MALYEVDLRSRITGDSVECIYSGDSDTAHEVMNEWYRNHPTMSMEDREGLIDGTDGVFADLYVV